MNKMSTIIYAIYNLALNVITGGKLETWVRQAHQGQPRVAAQQSIEPQLITLNGRQFALTARGREAVARARMGDQFIFNEAQLGVVTCGTNTPRLGGRLVVLTEGQLGETIAGRPLHELTEWQITYEDPALAV